MNTKQPNPDEQRSKLLNAQWDVLQHIRLISPEEDAARDEADRKAQVRATWEQVPRSLMRREASPVFEQAVTRWQPGASLMLLGPTRSGKTTAAVHLVARLCREAVRHGGEALALARSIYWVRADDLTAAGRGETEDDRRMVDRAKHARLLVLDDFAEGSKTIHKTIQRRYDIDRAIVLTSGLFVTELKDALGGDAVFRWLLEAGERPGSFVEWKR